MSANASAASACFLPASPASRSPRSCAARAQSADLIVLRALQGAAGGGLQPVGQAILADSFPREAERGMASAIYGIAAVVAPAVGPTLGGWIADSYNWRWIFLINVRRAGLVLCCRDLTHQGVRHGAQQRPAVGGLDGVWLCALSLGYLQVVLDRGQDADWSAGR